MGDFRKNFLSLEVCINGRGPPPLPQCGCSFYRECRITLKHILRATDGFCEINALYYVLAEPVRDDLTDELGTDKAGDTLNMDVGARVEMP